MIGERSKAVAWTIWGITLALIGVGIAVSLIPESQFRDHDAEGFSLAVLALVFATTGSVIVTKVPDNKVGWIYAISGLLGGAYLSLASAAQAAKIMGWDTWVQFGALAAIPYFPWIFSMVVFPVLLFPDGTLPNRRWRPVLWSAIGLLALWVGSAFAGAGYSNEIASLVVVADQRVEVNGGTLDLWPDQMSTDTLGEPAEPVLTVGEYTTTPGGDTFFRADDGTRFVTDEVAGVITEDGQVTNPLQLAELSSVLDVLNGGALVLLAFAMVGTIAAVIVRFRRSEGVERLQMKWLAFSASFAGAGLLATYVVGNFYEGWLLEVFTTVGIIGAVMIPVTTGMAIVRYRLYDVDRLISRTVLYGLLIALLGGVYASIVYLFSQLLPSGNSVSVAISTLAVAALFNPLRKGIQAVIDRRLYRAHYRAEEVVNDFSDRLRHGVDMESIEDDLLVVIGETVKPEAVGIWIRQPTD